MSHSIRLFIIWLGFYVFTPLGYAQSCPNPGISSHLMTPTASDQQMLQRAKVAYLFWFPAVSAEAIFEGSRNIGIKDNEGIATILSKPYHIGFTLNSDTPYGGGVLDLSQGPIVIDIPPGPYVGVLNDHYQNWIVDLGIPGLDHGKGGKYLILPPAYKGKIPSKYYVRESSSYKVLVGIRALPLDGNMQKAINLLKKIKIYPYSSNPYPKLLKFVDANNIRMDTTPLRWETSLEYWRILHHIINTEPNVKKYLPMYELLASLDIERDKLFNPNYRVKKILERATKIGHEQLMRAAFKSTRPDRIAWKDRKWEWVGLIENPYFETAKGIDFEARERWFAQAIVTSPAMFRRQVGMGSLYWLSLQDNNGNYLNGSKSYRITIPLPVPAKLFWSITVYDRETRSEIQTDQNKAALRSLFELKNLATKKEIILYFSPKSPVNKNNFWIKTIPGKFWFAYLRIYGPEQSLFNHCWKPGDFIPCNRQHKKR